MGDSWMFSAPAVVGDNQEIDSGLCLSVSLYRAGLVSVA